MNQKRKEIFNMIDYIANLDDIKRRIEERLQRKKILNYKKRPKKLNPFTVALRDGKVYLTAEEHLNKNTFGQAVDEKELKKLLPEFLAFEEKERQELAEHLAKGLIKLARDNDFDRYTGLELAIEDCQIPNTAYKYIITAKIYALPGEKESNND